MAVSEIRLGIRILFPCRRGWVQWLKGEDEVVPALTVVIRLERVEIIDGDNRQNFDAGLRHALDDARRSSLPIIAMESPVEMDRQWSRLRPPL